MPDLADVKAWLNIAEEAAEAGVADTYWDAELTALLNRTIYAVQRELDWYFGSPRSATEILNGTGTRGLWLRQYVVGNSLVMYERTGVGDAWEVVDTDDYEYEAGSRGVFNVGNWVRGVRNYRAIYNEGFTTWPGDVEQLVLDFVTAKWKTKSEDTTLLSETIGDYSYTRGDLEAMPGWKQVAANWKRGRV